MTTTIIKYVDPTGGGDYTTLAAAESANRQNLVTTDSEIRFRIRSGGSVGPVSFAAANWTTGPKNRIYIEADTGHGHSGIYTTSKAYIPNDASNAAAIYTEVGWIHVGPGICLNDGIYGNSGSNVQCIYAYLTTANQPIYVDRCIFTCSAARNVSRMIWIGGTQVTNKQRKHCISNCIMHDRNGQFGQNIRVGGGWAYVYGCTLVADNNVNSPICLSTEGGGNIISDNNYLYGKYACYYVPAGSISKGTHDATWNTEATTVALRNVAFTTANFVNVTAGSENLHLATNSALVKKGAATYTFKELGLDQFPIGIGRNRFLVYNNKIWSIGGQTGGTSNTMIRKVYYSSDGKTWTEAGTDALPIALADPAVCVYDNKMWCMAGGWTNVLYSRKVFYSTDGITWTEAGTDSLPVGLNSSEVVAFNGKMWSICGEISNGVCTRKVHYSTDGITWTEAGTDAMPHNLASHMAIVYNDKIYVIGGDDSTGTWQSQSVFVSSDGINWTEVGTNVLPRLCFYQGGIVYKNKLWIIAGWPTGASDTDPSYVSSDSGATWTQVFGTDLPYIYDARSTVLFNGQIYTMLGSNESTYQQHIYVHDEPNKYDIDGDLRPWDIIDIGADQVPDLANYTLLSSLW